MKGTDDFFPTILAQPIARGMCPYSDIYVLSLGDFVIMNAIIATRDYNEARIHDYYSKQATQ